MRRSGERGQAVIETVLMIWLFALLLSAIIQVFLAHNYAYQMANNAYYSLFKDRAYGRHNKPDQDFAGYPNWYKKPLRSVAPLQQAGGKVHKLEGEEINWSQDDRAAIPMMPFLADAIVEELQDRGITRAPVRLKLGNRTPGKDHLETKYLRMAMGTAGGLGEFFDMIGSIIDLSQALGENYLDFTEGYSESDLEGERDDFEEQDDELHDQDPNGGQKAKDQWDEAPGHDDFDHDGYNDYCEAMKGNNHPSCKNDRPWE